MPEMAVTKFRRASRSRSLRWRASNSYTTLVSLQSFGVEPEAPTAASGFQRTAESAELFHDLVGNFSVVVDVLHVVQVFEHIDQLEHLLRSLQVSDRCAD